MRHAILVCLKDLRQRLRDRTAILTSPHAGNSSAMVATRGLLRDFMNRAAMPHDRAVPEVIPLSAGGQMRVVDEARAGR
jgi:hypothetical protein